MRLPGVILAAGRTARAKAYAQAMARENLEPDCLLIYGGKPRSNPSPITPRMAGGMDVSLHDLSIPLEDTAAAAGWSVYESHAESVNDPEIGGLLKDKKAVLVIYAGYGGQIVSANALSIAPFLHIHTGRLPEERGSTTIYYSILKENRVSATAILLERGIDTGPVLMSAGYPLPPPGLGIDLLYDPAIRADLLVRVLKWYAENGRLPSGERQDPGMGEDYYVIHPVLKHIAMLSIR